MRLFSLFFLALTISGQEQEQPNIVFVLLDDLGWSDVGWNNENAKTTPYLKKLVENDASMLKQSYATHRCTPSRASFLTGRYAFRFGLGSDPISLANPKGMSLDEKLLPEFLQEAGYATHHVGKWHLGFCNSSYLPHSRGFDTSYGHYTGAMDYTSHAISGSYGEYLNHFHNGNPHRVENYTYATFDWGQRAQEVLNTEMDKPKFVYLAFNAPHEKVVAPRELLDYMRAQHEGVDIPATRIAQMAAVYAVDLAMKDLIEDVKQQERETIIVFHSDNGGSIKAYGGKDEGARSCNYPYRGFKNSLFEGGTLSPTFIYSTSRKFKSKKINNIVHITDWLPTFLGWAGYTGKVPTNLDGIDQRTTFDGVPAGEIATKVRTKFIYGVLNTWDEDTNAWTTQYAVRFGNWKYMNFRRDWAQTSKCSEGWSNPKHEKHLFPTQPNRKWKMKQINETAHDEVFKPSNASIRTEGWQLFNLHKDPFELKDYGKGNPSKKLTKFYSDLISEIHTYVMAEMQKGFQYPITGKLRGKLMKRIMFKMTKEERVNFFHETGRFKELGRREMTGTLGTDWCPAEKDRDHFLEMYDTAVAENNQALIYLLDLQLYDGLGPDGNRFGQSRMSPPVSRFGSMDDYPEDIWDDDDL